MSVLVAIRFHVTRSFPRTRGTRQHYAQAAAYAHANLTSVERSERVSYRTVAVIWVLATLGHAELKLASTNEVLSRLDSVKARNLPLGVWPRELQRQVSRDSSVSIPIDAANR